MSEIGQYMSECPECGAAIDVHPDALEYVDCETESGCDGTYEYDRDICLCPRCGQRFVRTCEYLPVPRTYKVRAFFSSWGAKGILDCPYCRQQMDVSEDVMERERNLDHGWIRDGIFGSEDVCRCPHCSGEFVREIEYDLRLDRVTVEKETD